MSSPSHHHAVLSFEAAFFDGHTSERRAAKVTLSHSTQVLRVAWDGHTLDVPLERVQVDARLGGAARCVYLPGDALLESADHEALDRLEAALRGGATGLRAHALESSWLWALGSVLVVALVVAGGFRWGVPWLARKVADELPADVVYQLGKGALDTLDKILFEPSELPPEKQAHVSALLETVAQDAPELPVHLACRKAGQPNAFALPDGTVVVTDEFVALAKSDEELIAVLAHEVGHLKRRHSVRLALENSAVGLVAIAYLGDASQLAGVVAGLPTLLANAHYSQAHETEADTEALLYLRRHGLKTAAFADILSRMEEAAKGGKRSGKADSWTRYLESHPGTDERMKRFRDGK